MHLHLLVPLYFSNKYRMTNRLLVQSFFTDAKATKDAITNTPIECLANSNWLHDLRSSIFSQFGIWRFNSHAIQKVLHPLQPSITILGADGFPFTVYKRLSWAQIYPPSIPSIGRPILCTDHPFWSGNQNPKTTSIARSGVIFKNTVWPHCLATEKIFIMLPAIND